VRSLVLDLARVGEATYASLPPALRTATLGASVVALVDEVGPLGLETARLQVIEQTRGSRPGDNGGTTDPGLREACAKRVRLLEQTVEVLTRIARHGADSDEAALVEASALLDEVRAAAERQIDADREIDLLLAGPGGL
jgi:hypothetical protein